MMLSSKKKSQYFYIFLREFFAFEIQLSLK